MNNLFISVKVVNLFLFLLIFVVVLCVLDT